MRVAVSVACLAAAFDGPDAVDIGAVDEVSDTQRPERRQGTAGHERAAAEDGRRQARPVRALAGGAEDGRADAAPPPTHRRRPVRRSPDLRTSARTSKVVCPSTPYGAELLKTRQATNSKDNPEANCLPMGIIQLHTQGAPRKFIQTPRELVILYEASSERREIFTDGRTLPTDDPQPWFNGYSVGHWDGDTLVVETVQFRDDGWLDINGSPLTERREGHGALPPADVRAHGDRRHDRGQEGVHEALHRPSQPAADARRGADRVHVPGEPALRTRSGRPEEIADQSGT